MPAHTHAFAIMCSAQMSWKCTQCRTRFCNCVFGGGSGDTHFAIMCVAIFYYIAVGFKTQPGAWFIVRIGYLPTHPCFPPHVCIPYYRNTCAHINENNTHTIESRGCIYVLCLCLLLQKQASVMFKHHMHQIDVLVRFLFDCLIARCLRKLRLLWLVFSTSSCCRFGVRILVGQCLILSLLCCLLGGVACCAVHTN